MVARIINLYELSYILHKLHNVFVTTSVFILLFVVVVVAVYIYLLLQHLPIFHRHCDDAP